MAQEFLPDTGDASPWGKTPWFGRAILRHVVFGEAFPTINSSLYFALYSANPCDLGNNSDTGITSGDAEANYAGYARVAVVRNNTNFTNTGLAGTTSLALMPDVVFPACLDSNADILPYIGICAGPNTSDPILWYALVGIGTASTTEGPLLSDPFVTGLNDEPVLGGYNSSSGGTVSFSFVGGG